MGVILLSAAVGLIAFKEHLTNTNKLGLALAVIAIVFISWEAFAFWPELNGINALFVDYKYITEMTQIILKGNIDSNKLATLKQLLKSWNI